MSLAFHIFYFIFSLIFTRLRYLYLVSSLFFFNQTSFIFALFFTFFLFFLSALYLSSFYRALISHMPIRSGSMMMKIEDEGKLDCCSSVDLKTVELEHAPNLLTFLYKFHFDNTSADKETNYVSTLLDQYRFV